jgi:hypothetical protein
MINALELKSILVTQVYISISPVKAPESIDVRREEIGLISMKKYTRLFGVKLEF